MPHKFGVHWIKTHGRPTDLEFVRQLQPLSIKFVAGDVPDVQWVSDAFRVAPNALFVLRSHAMSEQKDDQRNAPQVTGNRHALEWRSHVDKMRSEANRRGIPFPDDAQIVVLGINEPVLHADGALPPAERIKQMRLRCAELNAYTVAMCDRARAVGLTVGAMNLSVGWPTNWDLHDDPHPGAAPDWSPFREAGDAIARGKHYLMLHEYWADRGPQEQRLWWAQRYTRCPWSVPIIIGECGVDMYVKNGNVPEHQRGWVGRFTPAEYVAQLREYHESTLVDARIHSIQVYTSDYSSPWQSFDLESAYPALLEYVRSGIGVQPTYTAWTAYITASAGLNLRQLPMVESSALRIIPMGDTVNVIGRLGDWYKVEYQGATGFVSSAWISESAPPVTSPPPTTAYSADFLRAVAFVLNEEKGLVDSPHDPGGLTNWGISQRAYPSLDIRNLTKEAATALYFKDYWLLSGADKLPWPLALAHFDTAVNSGVSAATRFLTESKGNVVTYLAKRLFFVTNIATWASNGAGWTRRISRLMEQAA